MRVIPVSGFGSTAVACGMHDEIKLTGINLPWMDEDSADDVDVDDRDNEMIIAGRHLQNSVTTKHNLTTSSSNRSSFRNSSRK